MNKIVFFDVDGTLLPANAGRIPKSTESALLRLKENGIGIVLCTGRHPHEIVDFQSIPFDGYVLLNGQLCLEEKKAPIFTNPIKGENKKSLLQLFNEKNIPVILVELDRLYMNIHSKEAAQVQHECSIPLYPIEEYRGADILMSTIFTDKDIHIGDLTVARWHTWACDVYNPGDGKSRGVKFFLDRLGIARENAYAFGDAYNDIDMIRFAGTGIAMGNAYTETKAAADYVTDTADHDGIAKALKHFSLI